MRARVVAPLVAAVLGISGGVATAIVVPADDAPGSSAVEDPLHLQVPLVEQDCSGESLLILGYGNSVAPLSSAIAGSGVADLRYLSSAGSCATVLGPEGKPAPDYAVYGGPYSRRDACVVRMSGDEPGSFVTVLREGNTQLVKCPCEIPDQAPDLNLDMTTDAATRLWVRGLQAMLNDDDASAFPRGAITGDYDEFTAARVATYQANAPGKVTTPGEVDETTWELLTSKLCRNYDY